MFTAALLLVLVLISAVTDLKYHKIYNWTTYPGIAAGLLVHALGWDEVGLEEGLKGLAACGVIMLVCFVLFGIGGGDVKLIAMIGAFLGLEQGLEAMLWTFVVGGAAGLAALIWRVGFLSLVKKVARHLLWMLRLAHWLPLSESERNLLQPPLYLAPSAVVAVLIVTFHIVP